MSKAEFSWIKDLISTDEKALGVYLAVLHLRFSGDFESISQFEQLTNRYIISGFQSDLEIELIVRKAHGEVEVFKTTETFDAFVTFFKKFTKYVKTDLVLNAKRRNVLLERIEAEFFKTFAKAYKKLWLRLNRIPSEYRKTTALLLRKIRSREIEVFDETISGTVRIIPIPIKEEGVLLEDVLKPLNLPMNKINEFKQYMSVSNILDALIIPAPCFMDDVLRFLEEGVVEEGGIDLKKIARLRSQSLSGLVSGYGCSDFRFRPVFPSGVLPSGFEDTWECCLLGEGGWGSAYLCRKGNVKAVFKTPRGFESIIEGSREPPTVHSKTLEKVRNEANTISKLEHPNIIKLLGYSEKAPLLIYEYADYGTLYWQLSKGWKPSQKDILLIGIQLGDALRYLHSKGLIHGDIKPGNVFIKDGVIKLGDFSSITKLLASSSHSGVVLGTIGFRAPEQVYRELRERAKEEGLENRIDVYQLANLMLYMLRGESIDGEDVNDKLVAEKLEGIPYNELKRLIGTGLAVEPEKRPSAEELIKQLYTIYKETSG
jgi:serine/threonine-protein kinase